MPSFNQSMLPGLLHSAHYMSRDKNFRERMDVAREVLKEGGGDERIGRRICTDPGGLMMVVVVVLGRSRGGSHHYHNWTSMSK